MSPLLPTLGKVQASGCGPRSTATGQEAEKLNQRLSPYQLPYLGAPSQLPQFSSVSQFLTLCDPVATPAHGSKISLMSRMSGPCWIPFLAVFPPHCEHQVSLIHGT